MDGLSADAFFSLKEGVKLKLNTELWFGLGLGKGKAILEKDQIVTVKDCHIGFFDYFVYVETDDNRKYKLKIQSLELT